MYYYLIHIYLAIFDHIISGQKPYCRKIFIMNKISMYNGSFKIAVLSISIFVSVIALVVAIIGISLFFGYIPDFYNSKLYLSLLCFSLPFTYYLVESSEFILRLISRISILAIVAAILLSGSITAIACIAFSTLFLISKFVKKKIYILPFLLIGVLVSISIYPHKKEAIQTRILIAEIAMNMIEDKPILGFGWNGFSENYAEYQYQYFKQNPENKWIPKVSDIKNPMNEFILVTVCFGFVGLLVTMGVITLILFLYKNRSSQIGFIAFLVFVNMLIYSLFSNPFSYPSTWVLFLLMVLLLMGDQSLSIKDHS